MGFKAILFYDWLLCLDQEIACVWKAGGIFNAASLVYGLSRFPLMLGMIFTTATIFPLSAPVSGKVLSFLGSTYSRIYRGELSDHSMCPLLGILITTAHSCHFVFWADNFVILLSRFAIGSTCA